MTQKLIWTRKQGGNLNTKTRRRKEEEVESSERGRLGMNQSDPKLKEDVNLSIYEMKSKIKS